eukprot:Rmarinus@m.25534
MIRWYILESTTSSLQHQYYQSLQTSDSLPMARHCHTRTSRAYTPVSMAFIACTCHTLTARAYSPVSMAPITPSPRHCHTRTTRSYSPVSTASIASYLLHPYYQILQSMDRLRTVSTTPHPVTTIQLPPPLESPFTTTAS